MPSWYPANVVVRSRLTAPLGPMRPAQAAAGCVLTTNAATRAAAPAMNRLMTSSSLPALAGWRLDDGPGGRFPAALAPRGVGRAEHPEVRRRLVGQEIASPAVGDRAVEHQHLPEAVGLRLGDERAIELQQPTERVSLHELDDAIVELLRRGAEAIRTLRVVRVPVVARRDERDALARGLR